MTIERIEQLLGLLPPEAPYLARIPRPLSLEGIPPEVDICAHVLNDPGFGWMFVKSFLDLGRQLPAQVYESELVRPYCQLRYLNDDREAREAIELEQRANYQRRLLLRCMLLRAEYDYGAIAKKLSLSEDTIGIYQTLFWNVRDRDRIYVTSLVYPDTRLIEFVPGYPLEEHATNLVLRAAFDHGIAKAEELLGLRNPVQEKNGAQHARELAGRILRAGNFAAQIGLIHQDLPALTNARLLLRKVGGGQWKEGNSVALDDDDVRGLGGMSRERSLQELFLDIMRPELERQLALQNCAT